MALGIQHQYIPNISVDTDGEVQYAARTTKGIRYENLHCSQAFCDSACGPVTVIMAALVMTGLPRYRAESLTRTKREPFRTFWAIAKDLYFVGTGDEEISALASVFTPKIYPEIIASSSAKRIGRAVVNAVKVGNIPIVCVEHTHWSHYVLVVGYEANAGESAPRALLTLDSSAPAPRGSFNNGKLWLPTPKGRGGSTKCTYTDNVGKKWSVRLLSLVVLTLKPP